MQQTMLLPKLTEKTMQLAREHNQYTFFVRGEKPVSKKQIKVFVEENFDVEVEQVKSHNRVGKLKRISFKYNKYRRQPEQLFVVKLAKGDKIEGYVSEEE